jgi:hypothetical protein
VLRSSPHFAKGFGYDLIHIISQGRVGGLLPKAWIRQGLPYLVLILSWGQDNGWTRNNVK